MRFSLLDPMIVKEGALNLGHLSEESASLQLL